MVWSRRHLSPLELRNDRAGLQIYRNRESQKLEVFLGRHSDYCSIHPCRTLRHHRHCHHCAYHDQLPHPDH